MNNQQVYPANANGALQIYAAAIDLADTLMVTHIDHDFAGDAFAPQIDALQWHIQDVTEHTSTSGLGLRFVTYGRLELGTV